MTISSLGARPTAPKVAVRPGAGWRVSGGVALVYVGRGRHARAIAAR